MAISKIMYLPDIDEARNSKKIKLLNKLFGDEYVMIPNLQARQKMLLISITIIVLFVCLLVIGIIIGALTIWWIGVVYSCGITLTFAIAIPFIARRVSRYILNQAIDKANIEYSKFKPDILVSTRFGGAVALNMDTCNIPMVMIAPAFNLYGRYADNKKEYSIAHCPYVIIVHGTRDKTVPLDDSLQLVETIGAGKCRLEILDDNHTYKTIRADDLQQWIEEAVEKANEGDSDVEKQANDIQDTSDDATDSDEVTSKKNAFAVEIGRR